MSDQKNIGGYNERATPEALISMYGELGGNWPGDCEIDGLRLVCTCGACPEQYDVFDATGKQVGYLRLRHGSFRVDVPTACDETIYEAKPEGNGIFEDHERAKYLCEAVKAIKTWLAKQKEAGNDQA